MNANDLAFWLREEHIELTRCADDLMEKTAIIPRANVPRWLEGVRHEFDHFRQHMNTHQNLEERDGYMVSVVESQPALNQEVWRLAHEHQEISKLMDGIRDDLREVAADDRLLIRDCCRRIQNLLQYVEHHEKDEDLLVTSMFGRELGGGD